MTDRYQPLRDAIAVIGNPPAMKRGRLLSVDDDMNARIAWDDPRDDFHLAADPDTIAALLKERDHLHEECHEQARLLGMSGSREAKLLAERDALRAAIERHRHDLWGSGSVDHSDDVRLYAALAALADGEASNGS